MLLAQAVLGDMPSPLAMKALPQILLFPIFLSISLIPVWTFAAFTGFTAITTTFATLLCTEQSFWSEPILPLDCSIHLNKFGDNVIGGGGHHDVLIHHKLQERFPLVIPWDPAREVEDVLMLTHLRDCLCRRGGAGVGSISAIGRWHCPEIVILDILINPQYVVVNISAVL